MSKRPYELSVWKDEYENGVLKEVKVAVIGSDQMNTPFATTEPKLTRQINGQKKMDFGIYTRVRDNATGDWLENPFCSFICNESKIKLRDGEGGAVKWYDFIIKSIKEDKTKYTWTISAEDQWTIELSKNGFNKQFDTELKNNQGTATELASKAIEDTDWEIDEENTHFQANTADEALVTFSVSQSTDLECILIKDDEYVKSGEEITEVGVSLSLDTTKTVYVFYSCLANNCRRIQFIYKEDGAFNVENRLITDANCQYYIDIPINISLTPVEFLETKGLTASTETITSANISQDYRGTKYVYSPKKEYFPLLGKYGTYYKKSITPNETSELVYFQDKEYISPNLIIDLAANSTDFKSTAGWNMFYTNDVDSSKRHQLEYVTVDANGKTRWENLSDEPQQEQEEVGYTAHIRYTQGAEDAPSSPFCLVNSGPYDNRTTIKTFTAGSKYVLDYDFTIKQFGGEIKAYLAFYKTNGNEYISEEIITNEYSISLSNLSNKALLIINNNFSKSPAEFKNLRCGIVLKFSGISNNTQFDIVKCRLYSISVDDEGEEQEIAPEDVNMEGHIKYTHTWYYLNPFADERITVDQLVPKYQASTLDAAEPPAIWFYNGSPINGYNKEVSLEKIRSISIKDSNYYNILQKIAETFGMWLDIFVEHNSNGDIGEKKIRFRNYIGSENLAGFRYGVNLMNISRDNVSTELVTKLIVKLNSNEFGKDRYCSITRAAANETGGNIVYNLDYYIQKGLLNPEDWLNAIYGTGGEVPVPETEEHKLARLGYFNYIKQLNTEIAYLNELNSGYSRVLADLNSKITVAEQAIVDAEEELISAQNAFQSVLGFPYKEDGNYDENQNIVTAEANRKYSEAIWICEQTIKDNQTALGDYIELYVNAAGAPQALGVTVEDGNTDIVQILASWADSGYYYQRAQAEWAKYNNNNRMKELTAERDQADQVFYQRFYRYLQEGTWIDESYYDDDLYYNDALSTLYNSCYPKVSYSISVADLSMIDGYEDYRFDLGDQTFVEDGEMFGYNADGSPVHEPITITEVMTNFADPTKSALKVQTYRNQFQDLFSQTQATVQSVQYSEGGYRRAAALESASADRKLAFLSDALKESGEAVMNAGGNTTLGESQGLLSRDAQGNEIRINNGVIAFKLSDGQATQNQDRNGRWVTAISAKGINAELITGGQLNANAITIMNGTDTTFRWDSYGLSAFNFTEANANITINYDKFVRIDKFGIYGINTGHDGRRWKPDSLDTISNDATFYLTWIGLGIKNGNAQVLIGKNNNSLIKITKGQDTTFNVDQDGNVFAIGDIQASSILIQKDGNIIFKARMLNSEPDVQIAGWNVNKFEAGQHYIPTSADTGYWVKDYVGQALYSLYDSTNSSSLSSGIITQWDPSDYYKVSQIKNMLPIFWLGYQNSYSATYSGTTPHEFLYNNYDGNPYAGHMADRYFAQDLPFWVNKNGNLYCRKGQFGDGGYDNALIIEPYSWGVDNSFKCLGLTAQYGWTSTTTYQYLSLTKTLLTPFEFHLYKPFTTQYSQSVSYQEVLKMDMESTNSFRINFTNNGNFYLGTWAVPYAEWFVSNNSTNNYLNFRNASNGTNYIKIGYSSIDIKANIIDGNTVYGAVFN